MSGYCRKQGLRQYHLLSCLSPQFCEVVWLAPERQEAAPERQEAAPARQQTKIMSQKGDISQMEVGKYVIIVVINI